jgi:pimeloyl-ACP methyl ester carboxylesterase
MIEKYEIRHHSFSDIDWEYISYGESIRVILFLNGGLRLAESAYHYIKILCDEYRIIVPTYPPLDNVDDIVVGINEILHKEHIKNAIVIGQSYGGMIAQVFSLKYPEKVEKLILNSTASVFTDQLHKVLSLIIIWLILKMPSKWIRNIYKKTILRALNLKEDTNMEWIEYSKNILDTKLSDEHIISHFLTAKDTLKKYSDKKPIDRILSLTLIVNGEKDKFSTIKDHNKLIEDYPGSESVIIKKAGHVFAIEKPDYYKRIINEFVKKNARTHNTWYKKLPGQ